MDNMRRYYEVLGLDPDASVEARKQAYKDLVNVWHPDRFLHDPRLQQKAQKKLQEINEAYEKIKSLNNDQHQKTVWTKKYQDSSFKNRQSHDHSFTEKVHLRKKPKRNVLGWVWFIVLVIALSIILSQVTNRQEYAPSQLRDVSSSQSIPLSSVIPGRKTFLTIGSMKNEVRLLQGPPTRIIGDTWFYDASQVTFFNDRVIGYSNNSENLHMKLLPKTDVAHIQTKGYFTIGSTKDEVIVLQGTPSAIIGNIWTYGLSEIKFYNENVVSYSNISRNLKVKIENKK